MSDGCALCLQFHAPPERTTILRFPLLAYVVPCTIDLAPLQIADIITINNRHQYPIINIITIILI
eukprot:6461037-Amphidinium_carterae.1